MWRTVPADFMLGLEKFLAPYWIEKEEILEVTVSSVTSTVTPVTAVTHHTHHTHHTPGH